LRGRDFHGGSRRWWEWKREEESKRDKGEVRVSVGKKRGVGRGIDAEKNRNEVNSNDEKWEVGKKGVQKIFDLHRS